MWRPDFDFVEKQTARITGYCRRFWQASPDHRGTPQAPGRVVTLVPDVQATTEGVAFRLVQNQVAKVLAELDIREQGGYQRLCVSAMLAEGREVVVLTYYGDTHNPHYLGPAPSDVMLEQIKNAVGPSGANLDYLLKLTQTLRQLGLEDEHVFGLARLVREAG